MNTSDPKFEQRIRNKLSGFEEPVSPGTWENVLKELDKDKRGFIFYLNGWLLTDLLFALLGASLLVSTYFQGEHVQAINPLSGAHEKMSAYAPVAKSGVGIAPLKNDFSNHTKDEVNLASPKGINHTMQPGSGASKKSRPDDKLVTRAFSPTHNVNTKNRVKSDHLFSNREHTINNPETGQQVDSGPPILSPEQNLNTMDMGQAIVSNSATASAIKGITAEQENSISPMNSENAGVITEASGAAASEDLALTDTVYKWRWKPHFFMDALISPDYTWRKLDALTVDGEAYVLQRDSAEKARMAWSAMLRGGIYLNRHFYISTGFNYAYRQEKYTIRHRYGYSEMYVDSSDVTSYVDPFKPTIIVKNYDTSYATVYRLRDELTAIKTTLLDIPVFMGYRFSGRRVAINLSGGLFVNLKQISTGQYTASGSMELHSAEQPGQIPYKSSLGVGWCGAVSTDFRLTDKWSVVAEPSFRYYLKPLIKEPNTYNMNIWTMGVYTGIRYNF